MYCVRFTRTVYAGPAEDEAGKVLVRGRPLTPLRGCPSDIPGGVRSGSAAIAQSTVCWAIAGAVPESLKAGCPLSPRDCQRTRSALSLPGFGAFRGLRSVGAFKEGFSREVLAFHRAAAPAIQESAFYRKCSVSSSSGASWKTGSSCCPSCGAAPEAVRFLFRDALLPPT